MDSSPVLRQQSQNKIRSELTRTKNEITKCLHTQSLPNSSLHITFPTIILRIRIQSNQKWVGGQRWDQTTSDFGLSNYKWEDKLLAGKTRKKKPYTRPSKEASSAEPAVSAEACSDNMSLLSLKDPAKTSHATQNMQLTTQDPLSKSSTDKGDNFQSDHAALLSILCNGGLTATGLGSTTPHSKLYNYLPQRVSVMRSRHKLGPISGLMKSGQFSPDVAALQSILQNEGVKAGGPLGATPRISVCPGRGTSIINAQRVPVRKNRAEATEGPVVLAIKETPQKQWTPQRVPSTRNRPMSAMKWPLSSHQSPFAITPGLQRCKSNLKPQKEEIVQRLFDDQEEGQSTHVADKRAEQLPTQNATAKAHDEVNVEASGVSTDEDEEEEQRIVGRQPFFQAPQRDSVIFFSKGKTLLRAPRFEKQESSVRQEEHGPVLPVHEETRPVSSCQINPAQSLHRDLISQKPSTLSSAVALLRKRLASLEELRMDEEVAYYGSVPNAPCLLPPRPRCGNPLAYTLHFQGSFTFVPIGFDLLSGCSSPSSSPLQEK
ncbi:Tastin [Dissostichus eleginoides]|uniref:Tastin n=1 Tax=Dissostichus eleginoides TaxID=100907 RepID=A0AAD9CDX7_DISEL|nr:Tastin [Dissostichus eleginoides]